MALPHLRTRTQKFKITSKHQKNGLHIRDILSEITEIFIYFLIDVFF